VARAVQVAKRPLQVVLVTAAGLTLVFWDRPTPAVLIGVVLVLLLLLAVIEVLGSGNAPTAADAGAVEAAPGSPAPASPAPSSPSSGEAEAASPPDEASTESEAGPTPAAV
jgi:hypothetical protein